MTLNSFIFSGSAIYGLDFVTSSPKISLTPNYRRHCMTIIILDDNIYEKNETVGIHAGNDTIFMTILDNDCKISNDRYLTNQLFIVVQILFEKTNMTLSEDVGEFQVCVILQTLNTYTIIENSITLKLSPFSFPSLFSQSINYF